MTAQSPAHVRSLLCDLVDRLSDVDALLTPWTEIVALALP